MNACRQTDSIESRLARGQQLNPSQATHASSCASCGTTLAAAARLEASLPTVVPGMIGEPLPPAGQLLRVTERRGRWGGVALFAAVATAGAAATLVVLAILAGQFDSLSGRSPGNGPSSPPGSVERMGSVPEDMAGWAAAAGESIWEHMDRGFPTPELSLVRLERCGDTALAFFADPQKPSEAGPLLFGAGNHLEQPYDAGFGGAASSVDEPESAYARSQGAQCEVVYDTVLSTDDALAAYVADLAEYDRVRWINPGVLATKMVTADVALAYVTEIQTDDGQPHQQVLVLRHEDGAWQVSGAQGGDLPVAGSAVGVAPLGVAKGMPDARWAAVGRTDDDRVVAVELDFEGIAHRYPIAGGAFVIQLPPDVGFELPYRMIDADGTVVSEGTSQP